MSKNTVIYTRTATVDPIAYVAQERACRAYAEAQGWSVTAVYSDPGCSGANENRPGLQRLLKDVRASDVHAVLVTSKDRIARKLALWLMLKETFDKHNTTVIEVQEQL